MSEKKPATFDALIEEKLTGDQEFQDTLKDLSEDDKASAIESKRVELIRSEAPSWFEKASKNEELAGNYKVRAEKAETELGKVKPPKDEKKADDGISSKDMYSLIEAKVPQEDVESVTDYAKFKGISVADALKSSVVKATLAESAENRRTAAAMNVKQARSQSKKNASDILDSIKAKGEEAVPEKGSKEAEAVYWERRGRKNPNA